MSEAYLNPGLPKPAPAPDGMDVPYWEAVAGERLVMQHCQDCGTWQWGPEWICHNCFSHNVAFDEVPQTARIYSYERVWHPVHPALNEQGPYVIVLVEFPDHDGARMVGNLLGNPRQDVEIGAAVRAVFEHHQDDDPAHTLVHWEVVD